MFQVLAAFPVLSLFVLLQSSVISRITLLDGKADLILLLAIGWALQARVRTRWLWTLIGGVLATPSTALPFGVLLGAYLLATVIAMILQRRFWKYPFLAMLASVFAGTLIVHGFSYTVVILRSGLVSLAEVFNSITLPSLLLNILWAFPIYLIVRDIADWLYPEVLKA